MTDGPRVQGALECSFILSQYPPGPSSHSSHTLFPSLMPVDLLFFLAFISLSHNQPPPWFPVLTKSQEHSDLRETLHHQDGKCQVHKINANFMAPQFHFAKFYEAEKTWNLMLRGHLVGRKQSRLYPAPSVGSSNTRFIQRVGDCFGNWDCHSAIWGPLELEKGNGMNPGIVFHIGTPNGILRILPQARESGPNEAGLTLGDVKSPDF